MEYNSPDDEPDELHNVARHDQQPSLRDAEFELYVSDYLPGGASFDQAMAFYPTLDTDPTTEAVADYWQRVDSAMHEAHAAAAKTGGGEPIDLAGFSYAGYANLADDEIPPRDSESPFMRPGELPLSRPDCATTNDLQVYREGVLYTYKRLMGVVDLDAGNAALAEAQVMNVRREAVAYMCGGAPPESIRYGLLFMPRPVPNTATDEYGQLGEHVIVTPVVGTTEAAMSKLAIASTAIAGWPTEITAQLAVREMGYEDVGDVVARIKMHNARARQQLYLPPELQ